MDVTWVGSPNFGYPRGEHGRDGNPILAIIDHIAEGSCAGCVSWFQNPASEASSQYIVCRDGSILQFVADGDAAWANGAVNNPDLSIPWIRDLVVGQGINANKLSISVEHEGYTAQPLTEAQYAATLELHRWLVSLYGIPVDGDHITGHFSIDSVNRANCPGSAFPFDRLRADLVGGEADMSPEDLEATRVYLDEISDLADRLRDADLSQEQRDTYAAEIQARTELIGAALGTG